MGRNRHRTRGIHVRLSAQPADPPATALREIRGAIEGMLGGYVHSERRIGYQIVLKMIDVALAAHPTPAEGLDVERLTSALYRRDLEKRPVEARRHSFGWYRDAAEAIRRTYAALASAPDVTDQEGRP